jgi:class 3 adenylate cyclase
VVPTVAAPALVIHNTGDRAIPVEMGRWLGGNLPRAQYVELPGEDHLPFTAGSALLDVVEEFLTGTRPAPEPDRILATVLFTDIVGSTEHAARLGDRVWRDLLEQHHSLIRRELARFRGHKVGGIAVHIGARVVAMSHPGEVLVSSTVKDLVAGSGIAFTDRGTHVLKGIPGEWRLYSVVG